MKRRICAAMALLMLTMTFASRAEAKTYNWKLVHRSSNAPSQNTNKKRWYDTCTKDTVLVRVESFKGDGEVTVNINGSMMSSISHRGELEQSVTKGRKAIVLVFYVKDGKGIRNNTTQGRTVF